MQELKRAARAIKTASKIIYVTDYDNDGATCNYIGREYFRRSCRSNTIVMSNNEYPRGIHDKMVDDICEAYVDGAIMITADTGSDAIIACTEIKRRLPHMIIIITDHHIIPNESGIKAVTDIIVNAQCTGSTLNKHWCGANVVWELFKAVGDANIHDLIGYVAFANLIDQMSMADTENRQTYREGVRFFKDYKMVKFGLKHTRDHIPHDRWMSTKFAPILNSCHRFGRPDLAVRIMGGDKEAFDEAVIINTTRKKKTKELYEDLKPQIKANAKLTKKIMAVVTFGKENKPFCGLIASRITSDYKIPALVFNLTPESLGGSGRTVGQFAFKDALDRIGIKEITFRGHQGAFGVSAEIKNRVLIPILIRKYEERANENKICYSDGGVSTSIDVGEISQKVIRIDKGRPYGNNNKYPSFITKATVTKVKFSRDAISIFEIDDGDGGSIDCLYFSRLDNRLNVGSNVKLNFEIDIDLYHKLIVNEITII